ncbi:stress-response A/B barrel domain-containing protein UP3 [Phoenix dactylifera]|uniref:Stress-response A/B barrel domain-containing protein UP3 n=1 Tax=Phoenix dactylifera TaxID=42345 RepID=A0A8B7CEE2_PHODC|nr:stress-response A/B barrel domain-containing protein UP3 [Phoenix dactylifera]
MLSLKTLPCLHRPYAPFKSLLFPSCLSPPSLFSPPSPARPSLILSAAPAALSAASAAYSAATKMAAAACTTVEHVVLFKVRDSTDPSKIDAMISNLRSLVSLDIVSHLAAGPILRNRSAAASAAGFTHLLHSRYRSKPDLAAYSAHPAHQAVVKEHVLPICDNIMAVDWVADLDGPAPPPGSAMRLTLAKPKEGEAAAELLTAIQGAKGAAPSAWQVSYGENFSPARAKGYSVEFLSVFPGLEELDAMDGEGNEAVEAHKEKVRPLLESLIVVDFVVPAPPAASL